MGFLGVGGARLRQVAISTHIIVEHGEQKSIDIQPQSTRGRSAVVILGGFHGHDMSNMRETFLERSQASSVQYSFSAS